MTYNLMMIHNENKITQNKPNIWNGFKKKEEPDLPVNLIVPHYMMPLHATGHLQV